MTPGSTGKACLACGSHETQLFARARDAEYRTSDETFAYWKCECGALFIDPVPMDRLAEIYPPNYYAYAPPKRTVGLAIKDRLDRRLFGRVLRNLSRPELAVLDVGGGAGWLLGSIRAIDARVKVTQVVDLDAGAADAARASGHGYFQGRIEDFESGTKFDMILMFNIIEHVADPSAVLAKVRGLLTDDGIALIKTPNIDSLDARIFKNANWGGYHCPRHWVLFTRESFEKIVGRSGLRVVDFAYTQGAPFWAASTLFWLESLGAAKISRERPVMDHPIYAGLMALFAAFDFARAPVSKTSQMFVMLSPGAA